MKSNEYLKEMLTTLRKERTTYADMVNYCTDRLILNNGIVQTLAESGFEFEQYCGEDVSYFNADDEVITREEYETLESQGEEVREEYSEIFQYYIIDAQGAERFADYTNQLVIYCDVLNLYILCVTHCGTSWDYVSSDWKTAEEIEDK